jgi:hypothetical protein
MVNLVENWEGIEKYTQHIEHYKKIEKRDLLVTSPLWQGFKSSASEHKLELCNKRKIIAPQKKGIAQETSPVTTCSAELWFFGFSCFG